MVGKLTLAPLTFSGPIAQFIKDTTPEILVSGALNSGKTWAAIWKELEFAKNYPGIWSLVFRYSDDATRTKLRPDFERMITIRGDEVPHFDGKELYYDFPNGSRIYSFGLKSVDFLSRYSKLRGLGVSRILCDQAEELPGDIGLELRARLRQPGFPHQLTFVANPTNHNHVLAKQFPESNPSHLRKYYEVSIYDNAEHLPPETIPQLEAAYPPEHAKHRSVILGKRGANVVSDFPVYADTFKRQIHVKPLTPRLNAPILEAFEVGKEHACYVAAQRFHTGGWGYLGGILGESLFLEDFIPLVKEYRLKWFSPLAEFQTCCGPQGGTLKTASGRYTQVNLLQEAQFAPRWQENANAPDVVLAMIERLAGYMRRRSIGGEESLAVNDDPTRWLRTSREGDVPCAFLDEAFEAGYVWSTNTVSVGNKSVRCPEEDGWFELGMHAAENLELNFGAHHLTDAERAARQRGSRWLTYRNGGMSWA